MKHNYKIMKPFKIGTDVYQECIGSINSKYTFIFNFFSFFLRYLIEKKRLLWNIMLSLFSLNKITSLILNFVTLKTEKHNLSVSR